jgi:flavin-dependent dehydrogenase
VTSYDVLVVGGGPGGSSAAAFLARGGLSVAVIERDVFPRFKVGESLLPTTLPLLDRLGVHEALGRHRFLLKYGASFHDQETGLGHTFYFLRDKPWPPYAYQVSRAEFDQALLEHARSQGVVVHQPASADSVAFDRDGVTLRVTAHDEAMSLRGRFLVDASGRDGFLARRVGRSRRLPNLGKVAIFAHYRGGERLAGIDEGNVRIFLFDDGWFWWFPLANDLACVGCVLHARTVRARGGSVEALFEAMIGRCHKVAAGLKGAERITPVHRTANFSYVNEPVVGDRFLCVGDAIAFVDPIFSTGVYVALQTGEMAAEAILAAFADGRFTARRFAAYERRLRRGLRPFFRFIEKYYEPAFMELFLQPRSHLGMLDAVLSVLSGGSFLGMRWRTRLSLAVLFAIARVNTWVRRRGGRPVESRLEW